MKIFFSFILILFSVCALQAQDSTKYEKNAKKSIFHGGGVRLYYGIDNNNWENLNHFLSTNNFDGNFNHLSFNVSLGLILPIEKISAVEVDWVFYDQSYYKSNRNYDATSAAIKILFHYYFYNKKNFKVSFFTGITGQRIYLQIDTANNNGFSLNNYSTSITSKGFLNLPIGFDLSYHRKQKTGTEVYSSRSFCFGLRGIYNLTLNQTIWNQNFQSSSLRFSNPNYFELSFFLGRY